MSNDARSFIDVLRRSHDRLAEQVADLDAEALGRSSACVDWSVAQVLSHLGSQAEIWHLLFEAGLTKTEAPGREAFPPIWDAWNGRSPGLQARDSIEVNEAFVKRLEALDEDALADIHVQAFGMDLDAATLCRMRLSEHALHTWDVVVAFDADATIIPEAVEALIDPFMDTAARVGKPTEQSAVIRIQTESPVRDLAFMTDGVKIEPWSNQHSDSTLKLSGDRFIRLIYGRLRDRDLPHIEVSGKALSLDEIRAIFPGI